MMEEIEVRVSCEYVRQGRVLSGMAKDETNLILNVRQHSIVGIDGHGLDDLADSNELIDIRRRT